MSCLLERGPTDEQTASIARCSARTIHLLYGSTKAPSNGAGRPKTVKPPMRTALYDKLAIVPSVRLEDMVTFLRGEFEVELSRHSIRRDLRDVAWSKKATQNVARERNEDLRDDYMHEVSSFRLDQLVFLDESGTTCFSIYLLYILLYSSRKGFTSLTHRRATPSSSPSSI